MNKKMLVKVDGVVMTWGEALKIEKELIQTVIPGSFRTSRHAMPEFISINEDETEFVSSKIMRNRLKIKIMSIDKPVSIDKAIKFVGRHPLYDVDKVISGYAYKRIFNEKEEEKMNKKLEEMAVKALVRDYVRNPGVLNKTIVAFNDGYICGKIINKYGDNLCAKEVDLLSLRLTKLSMLKHLDVDTFLATFDNFEDACKAAEIRERLEYVNEKLDLDGKLNEIIDWAKTRPSEEYKEKFWEEHHKKVQQYSDDYDKEPVIWCVKNNDRIRKQVTRVLLNNICSTISVTLDKCGEISEQYYGKHNYNMDPHFSCFCNIADAIDDLTKVASNI